jgi:hypothetical protein
MTRILGACSGMAEASTPSNTSPFSQTGRLTSYRILSPGVKPISSSNIAASHMTLSRVVPLGDGLMGGG